tara:strand:+ start:158 stop:1075 length:918 start_codon:yes stop_codon:yes gene_type:complete
MYKKLNNKLEGFKIVCVSRQKRPDESKPIIPYQVKFSIEVNKDKDKITLYWAIPPTIITKAIKATTNPQTTSSTDLSSKSVTQKTTSTTTSDGPPTNIFPGDPQGISAVISTSSLNNAPKVPMGIMQTSNMGGGNGFKPMPTTEHFTSETTETTEATEATDYDKQIIDYILVKYINNYGPYINILDTDRLQRDGNLYKYVYTNNEPNITYKFGIIARNKFGIGNIENLRLKTVSISLDKVDINYAKKQKLYCDNTGDYRFVDEEKCNKKKKIIARGVNSKTNFEIENYERLMNDLNSNETIKLKI